MLEGLGLPLVNRTDILVVHNDQHCYASSAAHAVADAEWARLESCCRGVGGGGASSATHAVADAEWARLESCCRLCAVLEGAREQEGGRGGKHAGKECWVVVCVCVYVCGLAWRAPACV